MSQKTIKIISWMLTILLTLLFVMSALIKLTFGEMALEQASVLGIDPYTFRMLGVVEIVSIVLFTMPRTGVLGSLLLIAYMGGAIAVHVQHHQAIAGVVIIEGLIWVTSALRFPELSQRLFTSRKLFKNISIEKDKIKIIDTK